MATAGRMIETHGRALAREAAARQVALGKLHALVPWLESNEGDEGFDDASVLVHEAINVLTVPPPVPRRA